MQASRVQRVGSGYLTNSGRLRKFAETLCAMGAEPYWRRRVTIKEVYEKYKHFDKFLCDTAFVDSIQAQARYDMWQVIRATSQGESAPTDAQQAKCKT